MSFVYGILLLISATTVKCDNITVIPLIHNITVDNLPLPNITQSVSKPPINESVPLNPLLYVPQKFTVKLYKDGLSNPRAMIYTPTGDILVSEPAVNKITIMINGQPAQTYTFADATNGLNHSYGMAFAQGYFYVGNQEDLRRYNYTNGTRRINGTGQVIMSYKSTTTDVEPSTRSLVVSPTNDRIYVGIGSAMDADPELLPSASVQACDLDGTNPTTFSWGIRNPIGIAFHPISNDLYVSVQERDGLGDDLVPDYFTRIQEGEFFGWPYAYLSPNKIDPRLNYSDGASENILVKNLVSQTKVPDVLFEAHSAVLDMKFYTASKFPQHYLNGAFAAFHGSWNKNNGTGYSIVFVPFGSDNRPLGYYEDFVYGFLTNVSGPVTFGRPVGLLVMKDGSLLFSEDWNNRIYQVQYTNRADDNRLCFLPFALSFLVKYFLL
ncbi:unnamed protein product [Didymodactylos carnosus]|uniref:Pyrroloquinoline quinone-dependent pyranose dehydrogenase beta-propeller domain-containing protein n=1 Tax=Didymodactylos carnosus TaxID=1234261 RepID=A0A815S9A9_9BILA|nr:unnamed protein product [Didymodactylos carnosus]CAF1544520.1 unnamed protein product [Didymodactylos carnosus]CAF4333307.1 unnamed protein product [Didymodactylos carnosus]CAF4351571.1 unnamed protein product [Didymodactylos carnosus]